MDHCRRRPEPAGKISDRIPRAKRQSVGRRQGACAARARSLGSVFRRLNESVYQTGSIPGIERKRESLVTIEARCSRAEAAIIRSAGSAGDLRAS